MNRQQLLAILKSLAREEGSQARLAAELGVSTGYLNDVMCGRKEPGRGILEPLGLVREITYRRMK